VTEWARIFSDCLTGLIDAFAVLSREEKIAALELALRDLKCDAQQEAIDADFSGYNRADFERRRLRGSA
jgi:hypothetical protein